MKQRRLFFALWPEEDVRRAIAKQTNRLIDDLAGNEPFPFPVQGTMTGHLSESGQADLAELYSGQSVALSRDMPAAQLVVRRCLD